MRVLSVHNRYQQAGGEDQVFAAEAALLEGHGHDVSRLLEDNRSIGRANILSTAVGTVWNQAAHRRMCVVLEQVKPDLVHVHNTFPLLSPAIYYAVKRSGLPLVQTLHNYRLLCLNALLARSGQTCDACVGRFVPWPGIVRGCYRHSRAGSTVVAAMLVTHRLLHTWDRLVDVYIALTQFARNQFIEGGLPAEKIVVKPNFVAPDPGMREEGSDAGYALFVGRLTPEKGVLTLLRAWRSLPAVPLKIVGDGPLRGQVLTEIRQNGLDGRVELLGWHPREDVLRMMKEARVLVFPSTWYESFPVTLAEAFATGLPVIASKLGAVQEIVEDGRTGLHFRPDDAEDLAAKVEWAYSHPRRMAEMSREARAEFERKYTPERNYELLMQIYRRAIERAKLQ